MRRSTPDDALIQMENVTMHKDILYVLSDRCDRCDRCDRWIDAERARIEAEIKAGGARPHQNAMPNFNSWPESVAHHAVRIAWCSAAARDSRFWKNGDVVTAGRRIDQLELVMRYGPRVISDGEANDLAGWIETECEPYNSLYRDELEKWFSAEEGLFQSLKKQSWEDPFAGDGEAVIDLLADRGLDGLPCRPAPGMPLPHWPRFRLLPTICNAAIKYVRPTTKVLPSH